MELLIQGFKLTLFPDPAFLKFCYLSKFNQPKDLHFRSLNRSSAKSFLTQDEFTVLDYKLKKYCDGTPMGHFLVKYPVTNRPQNDAVCAHIHFEMENTSQVNAINFVHHVHTPDGIVAYTEKHETTTCSIPSFSQRTRKLVAQCMGANPGGNGRTPPPPPPLHTHKDTLFGQGRYLYIIIPHFNFIS